MSKTPLLTESLIEELEAIVGAFRDQQAKEVAEAQAERKAKEEEIARNEAKKTAAGILKFPNGAIVEAPIMGTTYCYIDRCSVSYTQWTSHLVDDQNLLFHNAFLTTEEAEEDLKRRKAYNRIYEKIKKIDVEMRWIPNWKDEGQAKYFVYWDYANDKKRSNSAILRKYGYIYMSLEAHNYLMSDAVSDEDFKLF